MSEIKKKKRIQSIGEEIANGVSHIAMVPFGIVALILLVIKANSYSGVEKTRAILAAIIFGVSMIVLYAMSGLYHALSRTKSKGVFKRFDHISIFILIGGTFAPPLLMLPELASKPFLGINGMLDTGLTLFIIQWVVIALGITFKAIWVYKFQAFHFIIYIILGWTALLFIHPLYNNGLASFWLILSGGIAYTIGVVFYALSSKVKYFHFVWHFFVMAGTILHFIAIYGFIY